ncbi:MAG: glycosyltransferase family 4 protein [Candidatus Thorarchaeota archaeon]|nr:glycosyltransferase family 4 protein [Candidatus Thorarchaeota archaeon]
MALLKRVVVFVEHFPPFLGSDRTIYELASRAAKNGTKVHFIAIQPLRYLLGKRPEHWSYKENWKSTPKTAHPNITSEYLVLNPYVESMWKRFPPVAYLLTVLLFSFSAIRSILRFQPQIAVAAHASLLLGVVSFLSSKIAFKPLFMGCPDWMSAYAASLVDEKMSRMGPVLLQLIEIILYKLSNGIFAVTHFLKRLLVENGVLNTRIVVIPNGVDVDVFTPHVDTQAIREKYRLGNRCVILFTGHLEAWAGVSVIYDLAVRLDKDYPESVILLVGSGDPTKELFSKLVNKNLGYIVVHAGLHPFEDMPAFTAASDIALCLFPNTPVSHAASPLKLFEYMAAGKAVVATAVTGTVEVMDNSIGCLVKPGNANALCDAVIDLCKNQSKRLEIGEAARKRVEEKYSWDQLSLIFVRECERLLN